MFEKVMHVLIRKVVQYYQIFCNLSLDIVLGVCCNMLPLPYCFGFHPGIGWFVGLPTAAWLMYLLDHVLDSIRNPSVATERHLFIRSNLSHIVVLMIALFVLDVYLLYTFYTLNLLATALILSFFCGLYFLLTSIRNPVFRYFYNKELLVACVYTSALYLPVGLGNPFSLLWAVYFSVLLLLTYLNLLMMSIIDLPVDTAQHQFSWVMMIGRNRAQRLFYILMLFTLGLCVYLLFSTHGNQRLLAACYMLMVLSHGIVFHLHHKLADIRKWSELIFWIPILVFLFL